MKATLGEMRTSAPLAVPVSGAGETPSKDFARCPQRRRCLPSWELAPLGCPGPCPTATGCPEEPSIRPTASWFSAPKALPFSKPNWGLLAPGGARIPRPGGEDHHIPRSFWWRRGGAAINASKARSCFSEGGGFVCPALAAALSGCWVFVLVGCFRGRAGTGALWGAIDAPRKGCSGLAS